MSVKINKAAVNAVLNGAAKSMGMENNAKQTARDFRCSEELLIASTKANWQDPISKGVIHVREILPNEISDTEMLEHLIENEDRLIRSIHTGMWTTTMAKRYFNTPREAIRAAMAGEKK